MGIAEASLPNIGYSAMASWPIPGDEALRLETLSAYGLFGSAPEPVYDRLTARMAALLDVPICLITVIGEDAQWVKSAHGVTLQSTPRSSAFCAHTITSSEILLVPDARQDARFRGNPLVTGKPYIRFYAGAPIITDDGAHVGALCAIDTDPNRSINLELLGGTSSIVAELFNERRRRRAAWPAEPGIFSERSTAIERAREILRAQKSIGEKFDPSLFGNPALSMLLALFVAAQKGRDLSVSECCDAAGLPFSTGQRLINRLAGQQIIIENSDRTDRRKRNIALEPSSISKIAAWLAAVN